MSEKRLYKGTDKDGNFLELIRCDGQFVVVFGEKDACAINVYFDRHEEGEEFVEKITVRPGLTGFSVEIS